MGVSFIGIEISDHLRAGFGIEGRGCGGFLLSNCAAGMLGEFGSGLRLRVLCGEADQATEANDGACFNNGFHFNWLFFTWLIPQFCAGSR